jgi:hypothetical protein
MSPSRTVTNTRYEVEQEYCKSNLKSQVTYDQTSTCNVGTIYPSTASPQLPPNEMRSEGFALGSYESRK